MKEKIEDGAEKERRLPGLERHGCFRRRWLAAAKMVAGTGGATSSLLCFSPTPLLRLSSSFLSFPSLFSFFFFFYLSLLLSFFLFLSLFFSSLSLPLFFLLFFCFSPSLFFFRSFSLLFFFLFRVPLLYLCIYRQRRAVKMPCLCPVRGQG